MEKTTTPIVRRTIGFASGVFQTPPPFGEKIAISYLNLDGLMTDF